MRRVINKSCRCIGGQRHCKSELVEVCKNDPKFTGIPVYCCRNKSARLKVLDTRFNHKWHRRDAPWPSTLFADTVAGWANGHWIHGSLCNYVGIQSASYNICSFVYVFICFNVHLLIHLLLCILICLLIYWFIGTCRCESESMPISQRQREDLSAGACAKT